MSSIPPYFVPAEHNKVEYEIKKSRFIGWACPAANREQAMAWLQQARQTFPDAGHHCWAYQIGPPHSPHTAAMSDDGEPNGTAGRPILNVLQHKDVGDLMVIVIRYFGGVKLGAGGLVRAYSHTAQLAMESLACTEKVTLYSQSVATTFEAEHSVRQWVEHQNGQISQVDYSEKVILHCEIPAQHHDEWIAFIAAIGADNLSDAPI